MLNEIGVNLVTLENEVNTSIQEAHPGLDGSDNESSDSQQADQCSPRQKDQPNDQGESRKAPVTYEQLREKISRRYCGSNLVQIVSKFQAVGASSKSILK